MKSFRGLCAVCLRSTGGVHSAGTRRGSRIAQMALYAALAMGVLSWIATTASATATTRADYQFQNTLTSSLGTPPALTDLGPVANSFATESVNVSSRTVLTFPADNGVQLAPTTGVIPNDTYTIVALFRFATVTGGNGWQRIVDFKDGTSDHGLYVHQGALELYPDARGSTAAIKAEEYAQVALTRDSTGTVAGYVDGAEQFSFDDSSFDDAVIDGNNTLRFFRDNESGAFPGEASPGAVARVRLYDEALTAEQVAALSGNPGLTGTASANVASLAFPSQPLDTLSAPQVLVVTNTGHSDLPIDRARMTGTDLNDFLLSSDGCSDITLPVGESCAIGVRFAPSASGERSATLSVSSADPLSPLEIPVSGSGSQLPQWQLGPEGRQGLTGKQGPAAKIELVTCTTIVRKVKSAKHMRMQCTTKLVTSPVKFTTVGAATAAVLSRGKLIYATGSVLGKGMKIKLLLAPRRNIAKGTYTLTLTRDHKRQRAIVTIG